MRKDMTQVDPVLAQAKWLEQDYFIKAQRAYKIWEEACEIVRDLSK